MKVASRSTCTRLQEPTRRRKISVLMDVEKHWQIHHPFLVQRILASSLVSFREAAGPAAAPRGEEVGLSRCPRREERHEEPPCHCRPRPVAAPGMPEG